MAVVEAVGRYRWVVLGISLLCHAMASLGGQMLAPLAPLFQPDLGLTKAEVGIFSSATFAGAWCISLVGGSLTDRFGPRTMMASGLLVTGALLLTMAGAATAFQAAAIMFLVGVARGTAFPGSTKVILEWFPPRVRATAMGIKQTGAPGGGMIAAATLPAVGLALGWRAAVAVGGFAVIASAAAALLYRDPPQAGGVATTRPSMRAGLRGVLANRTLWVLGSIAFVYMLVQQSMLTYMALYLKEEVLVPSVPEESARILAAGGYLALFQMGGIFGRVSWGVVSDRAFGGRRGVVLAIIGGFSALMALGMALLPPGPPALLLSGMVLLGGVCVIAWNSLLHTLVTESAGREYAGTAVGLSLTMVESGTTLGPPLFGLLVDFSGSFRVAWLALAAVGAVGTLMAALAARGERKAT